MITTCESNGNAQPLYMVINRTFQKTDSTSSKCATPLRVSEASSLLGLHPETIRTHLEAGRIKGIKLGRWLIPIEEINRLQRGLNS
jgi:excisionase family DNA binding protein